MTELIKDSYLFKYDVLSINVICAFHDLYIIINYETNF